MEAFNIKNRLKKFPKKNSEEKTDMQILKETTNSCAYINHTYILNDQGQMIAYMPSHDPDRLEVFKKPMSFYKTRRKFKEIKEWPNTLVKQQVMKVLT